MTRTTPLPASLLIPLTAVATVVGITLGSVAGPRAAAPGAATGDPALVDRLRDVLGPDGYGAASVALIEPDGSVRQAGLGADASTPFEIGSVTKPLTGMLLADAVDRGEVTLGTRLDAVVPGTGATTLQDLATHHSGLPRLPRDAGFTARAVWAGVTGGNPYAGTTPEGVLAWAEQAQPPGGAYSNLGASVLGRALAQRAGEPYPALLKDRILAPLGMTSTTVASDAGSLPSGHATPVAANGRSKAPWVGAGTAPAGTGVWSTTGDLAKLVAALAATARPGSSAGSVPGASATEAIAATDSPSRRIGLFWLTSSPNGEQTVWHNGASGGMRSFVGFQPGTGRGVVLLAATDADLDEAALTLLKEA